MNRSAFLCLAAFLALLCGCGSNSAFQPDVAGVDPVASNKLQFAVGIATIASNGGSTVMYGLNTVETLRQANGLSGSLYNVPAITLPTTMSVPANPSFIDNDAGTNRITQNTLNEPNIGLPNNGTGTTLASPTAGAFGYGFCECNSNSGPANGFAPLFIAYALPLLGQPGLQYYGGPPAFPAVSSYLVQQNFVGYPLGFTDFAIQPVLGLYKLDVAFPPAFTASPGASQLSASAQLTSTTPLGVFATPSFTPDRTGGGTLSFSTPSGVTEVLLFVKVNSVSVSSDTCSKAHATTQYLTVQSSAGTNAVALADNLGPPEANGTATRTICSGESYQVYAAGFDYPAFEAAYPKNLEQTPLITAPSGQADVTTSDAAAGQYP